MEEIEKVFAKERREVFRSAELASYVIGITHGVEHITCLCCGMTSLHKKDIENFYCGYCHEFHSQRGIK